MFDQKLTVNGLITSDWFLSIHISSEQFLAQLIKFLFKHVGRLFLQKNKLEEIFSGTEIIWFDWQLFQNLGHGYGCKHQFIEHPNTGHPKSGNIKKQGLVLSTKVFRKSQKIINLPFFSKRSEKLSSLRFGLGSLKKS